MPRRILAETGTQITSPPYSSISNPLSASSCLTRSGFALALSILFRATRIGTCAARACAIASLVWATPSSAATTKTPCVTMAPRAHGRERLMPWGVRKVILRPASHLIRTDVLSDAANLAFYAASARSHPTKVVLP
jgi:hypothetical protein